MSVELHPCPECSIAAGMDRPAAWDAFWSAGAAPALVHHAAVRYLTVGKADPTWTAVLSCGHAVPA